MKSIKNYIKKLILGCAFTLPICFGYSTINATSDIIANCVDDECSELYFVVKRTPSQFDTKYYNGESVVVTNLKDETTLSPLMGSFETAKVLISEAQYEEKKAKAKYTNENDIKWVQRSDNQIFYNSLDLLRNYLKPYMYKIANKPDISSYFTYSDDIEKKFYITGNNEYVSYNVIDSKLLSLLKNSYSEDNSFLEDAGDYYRIYLSNVYRGQDVIIGRDYQFMYDIDDSSKVPQDIETNCYFYQPILIPKSVINSTKRKQVLVMYKYENEDGKYELKSSYLIDEMLSFTDGLKEYTTTYNATQNEYYHILGENNNTYEYAGIRLANGDNLEFLQNNIDKSTNKYSTGYTEYKFYINHLSDDVQVICYYFDLKTE